MPAHLTGSVDRHNWTGQLAGTAHNEPMEKLSFKTKNLYGLIGMGDAVVYSFIGTFQKKWL